jgi:hypothetical protein
MVISFLVGAFGLYMGFQEWRLSRVVQDKPHDMTLAELIEKGPGDNNHIVLSEFTFGDQYVYQKNEKTGSNTGKVWVPIATPKQFGPVRALVKADKVYNENDMHQFQKQPKIQGVVVNLIESVEGDERKLLEQAYPGADIPHCTIIEIDRHKSIGSKMSLGFGMGGIGMFIFVFLLLLKIRDREEE